MAQLPLDRLNWPCTPGLGEKGDIQVLNVPESKVSAGPYTNYFIHRDKKTMMPKITLRKGIAPYSVNPSSGKQSLVTFRS